MSADTFNFSELKPFLSFREEITDPQALIEEFYRQFHTEDVQELFWEICKAALSSYSFETPKERANLIFFAEMMVPFFAAVHTLHTRKNGENTEQ